MKRLSYHDLILLPTFEERFEYLNLQGVVGKELFGHDRYLNQSFYTSTEWRRFRYKIIARDEAMDLACPDHPIQGSPIVHHIRPLTIEDFERSSDLLFDPDNVILVSHNTHEAIHYGDSRLLPKPPVERKPNDTIPWR